MEPDPQPFLHPRHPLLPVAGAFLAGLFATRWIDESNWPPCLAAAVATFAAYLALRRRPLARDLAFLALIATSAALLLTLRERSFDPRAVERITPANDTWTSLTAAVATPPETDAAGGLVFLADVTEVNRTRASGRIQVRLEGGNPPRPGEILALAGLLGAPARAQNPGQFDASTYLAKQRVFRRFSTDATGVTRQDTARPDRLAALAATVRDYMGRALRNGIADDPRIASIIAGMVYGDKASFDDATLERFRRTGTLHLFAVSGQNIGVLAAVALLFAPTLRIQRWRWGWLLILPLGIYVLATGAQSSAVRAWVMAALLLVAWCLDRPVNPLNLLSAAFLLILLIEPLQWLDTGFQLSFAVVFALAALTPWLYRRLSRLGAADPFLPPKLQPRWYREQHRVTRVAWAAVAASLAAGLGSAPLSAWHFHLASWVSPVVNLFVVPLASAVAVIGAMSLSVFWASPWLAALCNQANWLVAKLLLGCVALADAVPGGSQYVARPGEGWWRSDPRVTVMSVEAGQCALVETRSRVEVFDAASKFRARRAVVPCLKARGVDAIDALWLSQGDADHAGGASDLAQIWPVRSWLRPALPQRSPVFTRFAADFPLDPIQLVAPTTVDRGTFQWRILSPGAEPHGDSADDRSLVAQLQWPEGPKLLFAGDPTRSLQDRLLQRGEDLRSDVLLCGHSSRRDELSEAFLNAVQPRHLLFNGGGYQETALTTTELTRCRARGITVWHLPDTGAVTLFCEKNGLNLSGYIKNPAP